MRQRHRPGLQAKVLLIQVGIVLLVVGVVSATLQPLMESVRQADNLSFVVVSNRDRIRYSHPVPEEVGQPLSTDDQPALGGRSYVTVEQGTLGRSIRAKVPIFDADGQVIGVVSVRILEEQVQDLLWSYWPHMAAVGLGALLSGARSHLDALRAQAHEFANRLHTISGLLELGWPERAVSLINATTQAQQALVDDLPRRIDVHNDPGAVFDIWLPRPSASREAAAPGRQLVGTTG